jgi:hypothetical protein
MATIAAGCLDDDDGASARARRSLASLDWMRCPPFRRSKSEPSWGVLMPLFQKERGYAFMQFSGADPAGMLDAQNTCLFLSCRET